MAAAQVPWRGPGVAPAVVPGHLQPERRGPVVRAPHPAAVQRRRHRGDGAQRQLALQVRDNNVLPSEACS